MKQGDFYSISNLTSFHKYDAELIPDFLSISFTTIENQYRRGDVPLYRCELVNDRGQHKRIDPKDIDKMISCLERSKKLLEEITCDEN